MNSTSEGRLTRGLGRIGRSMTTFSVILVVSVLLILLVNLALMPFAGPLMPSIKIGKLHDWGKPEAKRWLKAYGMETMRKVYPDKTDDEIRNLIFAKFRIGNKYSTYVEFTHEPFVVNGMAFHEAGFRLGGKDQCVWPMDRGKINIFMFGGSTMFGSGSPDHETVSALLQERLRKRNIPNACAYNFGVGAYYSNQEVVAFWKLASQGIFPDLVLFLDGLNDYFQKLEDTAHSGYYREFERIVVGYQRQLMVDRGSDWSLWQAWLQSPAVRWVRRLKERTLPIVTPGREAIGAEPGDPGSNPQPTKIRKFNDTSDRKHVAHVTDRLLNNFRLAGGMAKAIGAESAFIVQPTPLHEFDLSKHLFQVPKWHQYTRVGYPHLQNRLKTWDSKTHVMWCADIGRDAGDEKLYVDPVHYSTAMNRRIVDCILGKLKQSGALKRLSERKK